MGYYVVYAAAVLVDVLGTLGHFGGGGELLPPPALVLGADLSVKTFSAAEGEDFQTLDGEYLTPHHMEKVAGNTVYPSALPYGHTVFAQQIVIFVRSVYKRNVIAAAAEIVENFLFLLGAVPNKTEIAAYYKCIALFQTV